MKFYGLEYPWNSEETYNIRLRIPVCVKKVARLEAENKRSAFEISAEAERPRALASGRIQAEGAYRCVCKTHPKGAQQRVKRFANANASQFAFYEA